MRIRSFALATLLPALLVTFGCGRKAPPPAAPPTVAVVEVTPERVSLSSEWVATLDGLVNAQIRPQVSGYLVRAGYQEGGVVKKGQVLFEIDRRPFAAAVAQATADLAEKVADRERTAQDVERDRPLAEQRAIPQSQLQNDIQANLGAQAAVASAQAAVDTAQLHLDFTQVRSLVDGVAAIASAQIGDLVGPETLLTTVSQVDPIRAFFSLSEVEYLQVAGRLNSATAPQSADKDSFWHTDGRLQLTLADGSTYPLSGRVLAADREIDARTGTIRISAAFPNPDRLLRPGQYGRVRAETRVVDGALLVPQRALSELQGGAQLRIVDENGKIHVLPVKLGERLGNRRLVVEGLAPGARVVVDSPQVAEGTAVETRPYEPVGATGQASGSTGATSAPAAGAR
ncbi:MAG: efflux RND transporter periplasmic adaptor subunit [Thermoanaerobaculia bacterium]